MRSVPELAETEVELVVVEPGDLRLDTLGGQFGGEVLIVFAEVLHVGCVVVGHHDGVVDDLYRALQTAEEIVREMLGVPLCEGRAQALAQLVHESLRNHRQGHLAIADVQVEGAGPLPAEGLIELKKLLDVPTIRVVLGEVEQFGAVAGGEERLVEILRGFFTER